MRILHRGPPCRASSPRIFIKRNAGTDCDCAAVHVTVIDVPAFLADIGRASARWVGHALSNRDLGGESKPGRRRKAGGFVQGRGEALQAGTIGPQGRGAVCAGRLRYLGMSFGELSTIAGRRIAGRDDQCRDDRGDTIVHLLLWIARILVHGALD
jgi:hypothetical protein